MSLLVLLEMHLNRQTKIVPIAILRNQQILKNLRIHQNINKNTLKIHK